LPIIRLARKLLFCQPYWPSSPSIKIDQFVKLGEFDAANGGFCGNSVKSNPHSCRPWRHGYASSHWEYY